MRATFKMEDTYITMTKGDTLAFNFEILEGSGLSQKIDTAFFTCKANKHSSRVLFQKSLSDGISNLGNGLYVVRVAPEDTKNVDEGKYFYDLQLGVSDDIFTVLKGILELEKDSTH